MLLGVVTIYDIRHYIVPNSIIVIGLIISLLYQFLSKGFYGLPFWVMGIIVPFVMLFLLHLFHVLGAGDVKLFMVIGSFLGIHQISQVIFLAFIIGAIMSVIQILRYGNLGYRMQYLANYIHTLFKEKRIKPYYNPKEGDRKTVIPFSVAILLSTMILSLTGKIG